MKGIVFSLALPRRPRLRLPDFRALLKRRGTALLLAALLLLGLILGAAYARAADKQTLHSLDFLFTTNLDARLGKGGFGTFCACFASDFIFLLSAYLLGAAAWGLPFLLALVCFKGFGTGVTAGYLCLSHGMSGAGFYLLVLLPGTFLFCLALLSLSAQAFDFSKLLLLRLIRAELPEEPLRPLWLKFSTRFLTSLLMTFFAAALDAVLWSMFAGAFSL